MAKSKVEVTDIRYILDLSESEARALTEVLWFVQMGETGRGALVSNIIRALDDVGLNPEIEDDWIKSLVEGKIVRLDSNETGIFWA